MPRRHLNVFQRHRRAHRLRYRLNRFLRLQCAAKVGVQHRPRQVNHRAQRALRHFPAGVSPLAPSLRTSREAFAYSG